jgi:hypothetical protein
MVDNGAKMDLVVASTNADPTVRAVAIRDIYKELTLDKQRSKNETVRMLVNTYQGPYS